MKSKEKIENNPFCKACHGAINNSDTIGNKNNYELLKCKKCGTVTVDPFPKVEELIEFYQSYEGSTDYRVKEVKKIARARKRIKRIMKLSKGNKFLDIGCNYGFTIKAASDLGLNAHGIDIDETAVNISKETFGQEKYTAISVEDYAAAGYKADMIYTSEVIEHVPSPEIFIKSISEILNKDGILYLTTPDGGHFSLPKDFTKWDDVMPPEHITYFTRKGMKNLLEKNGFKIKKFFFNLKPGIKLLAKKI